MPLFTIKRVLLYVMIISLSSQVETASSEVSI